MNRVAGGGEYHHVPRPFIVLFDAFPIHQALAHEDGRDLLAQLGTVIAKVVRHFEAEFRARHVVHYAPAIPAGRIPAAGFVRHADVGGDKGQKSPAHSCGEYTSAGKRALSTSSCVSLPDTRLASMVTPRSFKSVTSSSTTSGMLAPISSMVTSGGVVIWRSQSVVAWSTLSKENSASPPALSSSSGMVQ